MVEGRGSLSLDGLTGEIPYLIQKIRKSVTPLCEPRSRKIGGFGGCLRGSVGLIRVYRSVEALGTRT